MTAHPTRTTSPLPLLLALSGGGAFAACQWLIFRYAPVEATLGLAQKIFYIHLPMSWWALISFFLLFLVCRRGGNRRAAGRSGADHGHDLGASFVGRLVDVGSASQHHADHVVHLRGLSCPALPGYADAAQTARVCRRGHRGLSRRTAGFSFRQALASEGGGLEPEMRLTIVACVLCFGLFWAGLLWIRARQLLLRTRVDALFFRSGRN